MAVGSVSGADLEQLEALRRQLDRSSGQLRSIAAQSTGGVEALSRMWSGPDSAGFRQRWMSGHRPALQRAVDQLADAAATIDRNRSQQETTSAAGGPPGTGTGPSGFTFPFPFPFPLPTPDPLSEAAETALDEISDLLDDGNDVSNGELNRIRDTLESLTVEERNAVLAGLSDAELTALFHNVHSSGFWSNDWNDSERAEFYALLEDVDPDIKARVSNDPAVLAELRDSLSTDGYLDLLVSLNTDHSLGALPSASAADDLIREHLDEHIEGPLDRGAQAEGTLAIVDEENFRIAYENQTGNPPRDSLNGFVDDDGRQWVRESKANEGTPVHEALHNYSSDELRQTAWTLNEGVTEYFTLEVVGETDDPATAVDEAAATAQDRDTIYKPNRTFVNDLVDVVGEDAVAAAYFDGDIDGLKDSYIEATGRPESDWDALIDYIDDNSDDVSSDDWDNATDLLTVQP